MELKSEISDWRIDSTSDNYIIMIPTYLLSESEIVLLLSQPIYSQSPK